LVADPRFDPSVEVVLEGSPGHRPVSHSGEAGMARFRWLGTASARVDVDARSPAIVLVRNAYDPNWRATVDGRPAPVLAADYVLQGIPVAPGHHTILLTYRDPSIGAGLAGSALSLLVLFGSSVALHGRRRSPARHEADDKSPR
jgi:membrane protein YfhO